MFTSQSIICKLYIASDFKSLAKCQKYSAMLNQENIHCYELTNVLPLTSTLRYAGKKTSSEFIYFLVTPYMI